MQPPEHVLLLHGFAAGAWAMRPMSRQLAAAGFGVEIWSYGSLRAPVREHADRLRQRLLDLLRQGLRVHLVGHSMGAIVTRAAIADGVDIGEATGNREAAGHQPGHVVLLAPPNHGSPVARYLNRVAGRLLCPLADLSDDRDSFVNQLPTAMPTITGVIAAKYDHLVPMASTHLCGEADHLTVRTTHSSMLYSRDTIARVADFLRNGQFQKSSVAKGPTAAEREGPPGVET